MPKELAPGLVAETVGDLLAPNDLVLVFDTETSGIPLWHMPSDHADQPHVIELAAELCAPDGTVIETYNQLVNVDCQIHPDAAAVHGITPEMLAAEGVRPDRMLTAFFDLVDKASVVVGYSTSFDLRLMRIQAARHTGLKWDCPKPRFDVMFAAGKRMGKVKPKLTDAVPALLGRSHDGAHRALPDCQATRELYFLTRGDMDALPPKDRAENPRAVIGGNMPPEEAVDDGLTPYQRHKQRIEDLYDEAKNFLDGDPIATEGQAEAVAKLRDDIRAAASEAEKQRKIEAKPFDDGKAEVQARYNPLIQKDRGLTDLAVKACNDALAPWLRAKKAEQDAEANRLRKEAEEAAYAAQQAAQQAAQSVNLEQRQSAEDMLANAKSLLGAAHKAETARPQVAGGRRAVGLKTVWKGTITDYAAVLSHYRAEKPELLRNWLDEQVAKDVHAGARVLPGVKIDSEEVPC